ncbi:BgTH12-05210 [Blumeria graminis f. sp. triticale]|uniref:BgtE-10110 n=2 Tax=Blumeria graminis TaxID=34373 RepID=A0A9X9MH87_BLUGR|nr:BgTH12-05210 [Blumeria graminis f. sp. triticale]VDB88041.1 BgtE-10110 [Blumeria graminis f. sp. tritici]
MKTQSVKWLGALFCLSRLACADTIFLCGRIGITEEHIKTAYINSAISPIDGFPTVMKLPYIADNSDFTAYPIFLHGENRITSPFGHCFLVWSVNGINWGVVLYHVMGTQSCRMNPNYLGRTLISIVIKS